MRQRIDDIIAKKEAEATNHEQKAAALRAEITAMRAMMAPGQGNKTAEQELADLRARIVSADTPAFKDLQKRLREEQVQQPTAS